MAVEVKKYYLPPTALVPNSPQPLLHYPGYFSSPITHSPGKIHEIYDSNGWKTEWIFRYGPTQTSHYHSRAHECMTVLTGSATIRFGVADTSPDLHESTHGQGKETGGVEIKASAGDVFILPAGTAHKTFDTRDSEFALLTPGDGHGVDAEDVTKALDEIELSGFTMLGAYPHDGGGWNFAAGGEDEGQYDQVWAVPKPERDPILGDAKEGLCGLWQ